MQALMHRKLKFPRRMFRDASLIEFGSGTGEHSLFYLKWGAQGTFVEINELALQRMEQLFKHFGIGPERYQARNLSIFDYADTQTYDIVSCLGVLHHLEEKERALGIVARAVAPGGFLILGIGNNAGTFQRNVQRLIVNRLAGTDPGRIEQVAEDLFSGHLDRAEKYGRRSRRSIIHDTYVNPKIDTMSVVDILEQFSANGLELYSSWPPVVPALIGDSPNRDEPDYRSYPALMSLVELGYTAHGDDDATTLPGIDAGLAGPMHALRTLVDGFNDITPDREPSPDWIQTTLASTRQAISGLANPYRPACDRVDGLLAETAQVMARLADGDQAAVKEILASARYLFRGSAGLGITFYIGHRPEDLV